MRGDETAIVAGIGARSSHQKKCRFRPFTAHVGRGEEVIPAIKTKYCASISPTIDRPAFAGWLDKIVARAGSIGEMIDRGAIGESWQSGGRASGINLGGIEPEREAGLNRESLVRPWFGRSQSESREAESSGEDQTRVHARLIAPLAEPGEESGSGVPPLEQSTLRGTSTLPLQAASRRLLARQFTGRTGSAGKISQP